MDGSRVHQENEIKTVFSIKILIYHIVALFCLHGAQVDCFGWTNWNSNLLQSVSDCPTFDGNRTGICVATAAECRNRK